ncbi:hypothetical protein FSP39_014773 [Pinctada imbricata]|uniref:Kelch domain-containing protein 9 n=1 Tax=Pinctada imbricata TaxID=66713 RepID=A0AA89BZ65_PINIB|nr:hypothetical protein FSP39_014773 [Pinctada imbricata]
MANLSNGRTDSLVDWEVYCPIGPQLAFHVGCVMGDFFYVHGGITDLNCSVPSSKLFRLDMNTMIWNEVKVQDSPALSHHACIPLDNRYMMMIGGWNGKSRTSKVVIYDTEGQQWLYPTVKGFPDDAGLTSHTASLLSDGNILVIGREGSLRMNAQPGKEYTSSVYLLSGSIDKKEFVYQKYSHATESRSGHTTSFIGSNLYILGGRSDDLIEVHKGYKSAHPKNQTTAKDLISLTKLLQPLEKMPKGRRHHIALEGPSLILIHGGETFGSQNPDPVGEMFMMTNKPCLNFYKLGKSQVCRRGHICCVSHDKVFLHGGIGERHIIHGDTRELKIKK